MSTLSYLHSIQRWTIPCILLIAFLLERYWLQTMAQIYKTRQCESTGIDNDPTTWKSQSLFHPESDVNTTLLYVPLDFVETSILSSFLLRIDHRHEHIHVAAGTPPFVDISRSRRKNTFRWTFLREPTERIKSEFFSTSVSWENMEPSIQNFDAYLKDGNHQHYYLRTLLNQTEATIYTRQNAHIDTILQEQYHFIGITERLHESLVVMKLLWGINTTDLLYITPPSDLLDFNKTDCIYLTEPFHWKREEEIVAPWRRHVAGDVALYRMAVAKLDATIDKLGRARVHRHVLEYVDLLRYAHEQCYDKVVFPCTLDGERIYRHSCMFDDIGCGYKCLDELELPQH